MSRPRIAAAALAAAVLACGCAGAPQTAGDTADPWEGMNRRTTAFNDVLDKTVAARVARAYTEVVPQGVRESVNNAFVNLGEPGNAINNALQGKGEDALASVFRLIINTTFGIGGLFDVAGQAAGQPVREEDFGQTLAVWGVPSGPYLVLPLLGPSTVRDAFGLGGDLVTSPTTYVAEPAVMWGARGAELLNMRANALPVTDLLKDAVDPYVMARDGYIGHRRSQIFDGNPPVSFAPDEFEDEDEKDAKAKPAEGEKAAEQAAQAKP
ncbi:MAG: VacJ family lipoprotein [Duodenibacillus sp.]|nr:VacJ family lipoprotein [Duodenibacillus sp.]